MIQVHANDHSQEEIGVPNQDLLVLPGDVSIALRRSVLGFTVDEDQMKAVAQFLPPLPDEDESQDFVGRMLRRFQGKVKEIAKIPEHFILNDKIWPPYPGFILKNYWLLSVIEMWSVFVVNDEN